MESSRTVFKDSSKSQVQVSHTTDQQSENDEFELDSNEFDENIGVYVPESNKKSSTSQQADRLSHKIDQLNETKSFKDYQDHQQQIL